MTSGPPVLPPATAGEPVRYVLIDDEPRYRQPIGVPGGLDLMLAGSYGTVEAFLAIQRQPCHAVVLDLCLNRQTGDKAVLQGVRAIRQLAGQLGHRVVVYTADERPEPVARCVAAGAAAYISKYDDSPALARAVDEVGRHGSIVSDSLHQALRKLTASCPDVRLSDTLEETLALLETGMSDLEIASKRHLSARTIEDHKRKILEIFGSTMEARHQGFAGLSATWAPGLVISSTIAQDTGQHGDLSPAQCPGQRLQARNSDRRAMCPPNRAELSALRATPAVFLKTPACRRLYRRRVRRCGSRGL